MAKIDTIAFLASSLPKGCLYLTEQIRSKSSPIFTFHQPWRPPSLKFLHFLLTESNVELDGRLGSPPKPLRNPKNSRELLLHVPAMKWSHWLCEWARLSQALEGLKDGAKKCFADQLLWQFVSHVPARSQNCFWYRHIATPFNSCNSSTLGQHVSLPDLCLGLHLGEGHRESSSLVPRAKPSPPENGRQTLIKLSAFFCMY